MGCQFSSSSSLSSKDLMGNSNNKSLNGGNDTNGNGNGNDTSTTANHKDAKHRLNKNPLLSIDTGSNDKQLLKSLQASSLTIDTGSNISSSSSISPILSPRQIHSVKKIQRSVRRKIAMNRCEIEHQWKIFNDLHECDEAEMLHLAIFMQTLLDRVPGTDKYDSTRLISNIDEEDDEQTSIKLKVIQVSEEIEIHGNRDVTNYKIKNSKDIDESVLSEIIEVYKHSDGALDNHLIGRILRKAYKQLKVGGTTRKINIANNNKINIIGDLHGSLLDLLHILDEAGLPSEINKFVFNGDFVDRGDNSVEVMTLLLTLLIVYPDYVVLNRGNHEDMAVNRVYGFQNECCSKYDELTYGMFNEIFRYLPLFTIINDTIFIVHGGLFHDPDVKIQDLDNIDRIDYCPVPAISYPENTVNLCPDDARKEYLKQLQRDALWSDPTCEAGLTKNNRGAGVQFGPDIANKFMENNNISMIIRSHECCRTGFEFPYSIDPESSIGVPMLCTLFSASNYCNGDNQGAYITIFSHVISDAYPIRDSGLCYEVNRYKTSHASEKLHESNKTSLTDLLIRKKIGLKAAFEASDISNTGLVSRNDWADIMQRATNIKIRWLAIIASIAPSECLSPQYVNYKIFLASLTLVKSNDVANADAMDAMYAQRKKLETVFYFFDTNNDGAISREEFRNGCAILNSSMPEGSSEKLTSVDHMLSIMDFDNSDSIDINEFFETFRLLDAADGKVDGVISLATNQQQKQQKSFGRNVK